MYTKNLPKKFFQRVTKGLVGKPQSKQVLTLLKNIYQEFDKDKYYVTTTSNIVLSRCVPVATIIRKRIRTCGSLSAVAVACLRKIGLQARLVDGKIKGQKHWSRHSWIEVYDPITKKWQSYDIFGKQFKIYGQRKRLGTYSDWSELEPVLRKQQE